MADYEQSVVVEIETTGGKAAIKELDGVGKAADRTEEHAQDLSTTLSNQLTKSMDGVARHANSVKDGMKKIGKSMAVVGGAAIAATAALAKLTLTHAGNARELKNMADIAGLSTTDLQEWGYAAKGVGMDMDGLSQVLMDFNDRVGDAAIGSGPLMDFLEQVGPQVGVTLADFQRLSSSEGLQLYVSSLEKAGKSQQDMTFYMESMSGGATKLLPLLTQQSEELNRLRDRARALGIVMSETDLAQLAASGKSFSDIGEIFTATMARISTALAPLITHFSEKFTDAAIEAGGWEQATQNAISKIIMGFGRLVDAFRPLVKVYETMKLGIQTVSWVFLKAFENWAKIFDMTMHIMSKGWKLFIDGINAGATWLANKGAGFFMPMAKGADAVFASVNELFNSFIAKYNKVAGFLGMTPLEFSISDGGSMQARLDALIGGETLIAPIAMPEFVSSAATVQLGEMADKMFAGMVDTANSLGDFSSTGDRLVKSFNDISDAARAKAAAAVESDNKIVESAEQAAAKLEEISKSNSISWAESMRSRAGKEQRSKDKDDDAKLKADQLKAEETLADQKLTVTNGLMSAIDAAMAAGSEKEFKRGKDAAIAMAVINTAQGATKAFGQGGFWGFAAAAAVIAAGMAQVNKIKQTKFKGGSGGAASVPSAPTLSGQDSGSGGANSQAGSTTQSVSINITGGSFGSGAGDDVIASLKDFFSRDGVLFDGASTQGQVIANG
jgi:hypothetical protein